VPPFPGLRFKLALKIAMRLAHPAPVLQYELCGQRPRVEKPMSTAIKFGTSGWRAIVADDFTVANIRLAVAGIAAYVKTLPAPHRVLVGRDPRFLGETFVSEAARVLAAASVMPIVIPEAAPTPAIAHAVRTLKTSGSINFTASHNPPEYNGIKYSTPDGAPALPEATKQIEAAIDKVASGGGHEIPSPLASTDQFETADVKPAFLNRLAELVDLKAIVKSGLSLPPASPGWRHRRNRPRLPRCAVWRPRSGTL
jgi:phosphomannomutase